jgi:hypothetical protein
MDPQVFWQGIREDFICENRDEAMEMLRERQREEHGVEALELIATEEKVVVGVRSTQLQEIGACRLVARSSRSSRCAITMAGSFGLMSTAGAARRWRPLEPRTVPTGYRSSRGRVTLRNSTIYMATHRGDCLGLARTRS